MAGKKSARQTIDEWKAKMEAGAGGALDRAGAAIDSMPPARELPARAAGKILQGGAAIGDAIGGAMDRDNSRFGSAMGVAGDIYNNQGGQGYLGQSAANIASAIGSGANKAANAGLGAIQGGIDLAQGGYDRGAYDFAPGEAAGYGMMGDARNAINQLGYDAKLGAQQGRFPPNPPAPYVGANALMDQNNSVAYKAGHPSPYGVESADGRLPPMANEAVMLLQQNGIPVTQGAIQQALDYIESIKGGAQTLGQDIKGAAGRGMDAMRGLLQ